MSITSVALVAAAAAAAQNCSRVVRVGTFDQATPYAVAPATRWLDDDRACFAYYRQPSGARALELLGRGDLDLAFMGSMPWSNAVARGAGVTAVSVLMDIKSSDRRFRRRPHVLREMSSRGPGLRQGVARPTDAWVARSASTTCCRRDSLIDMHAGCSTRSTATGTAPRLTLGV